MCRSSPPSEFYRERSSAGLAFLPLRPNLTPADKDLLRPAMDERSGPEYLHPTADDAGAAGHVRGSSIEAVAGADLLVAADLLLRGRLRRRCWRGIPWIVA